MIAEREMFADDRWQRIEVYERSALPAQARIEGPAIIQQMDATTVLEPGACATLDGLGNLRITVGGHGHR